jgi:D-tyrosyl-tRNA(Tyr) deacylase
MRAVVQRVTRAAVVADGEESGRIEAGLLVYLGVGPDDTEEDLRYLADKVRHLRIFPDEAKPLNRDVVEAGGAVLVVSAFTVQADARKGRRPTLESAAPAAQAQELYESFCTVLEATGVSVARGVFRAYMAVESVNDGPICILLDSRRGF